MKFLLFSLSLCGALALSAATKYVFLFIGDGMSMPQRMVGEEFARKSGYGPLAMNGLPYQCSTRTRSANQIVTDSAAAATAIACGEKANNGSLGVSPEGKRLQSVAEFAKSRGKKVGVMTTVTICHATPAGFYAHRKSRSESYRIGLDLVASGFDYFAGGGMGGKADDRKDRDYRGDIFKLAEAAGYRIVRSKDEFAALKLGDGKVWGVFSDGRLDFSIDWSGTQPTLAELVAKGAELLDNPNGFFIMAEGGTVDYGAHANDAGTVLNDVLALDRAVKVAVDWQNAHPNETLVITTGDHETGGMAMGFAGTGYNLHIGLLARQKISGESFSRLVAEQIKANPKLTFADMKPLLKEKFGFVFEPQPGLSADDKLMLLKPDEIRQLEADFANDVAFVTKGRKETKAHDVKRRKRFAATAVRLLSNHVGVGWTCGSHTALPTMTTAAGVGGDRFMGFLENADIARRLKALLAE